MLTSLLYVDFFLRFPITSLPSPFGTYHKLKFQKSPDYEKYFSKQITFICSSA